MTAKRHGRGPSINEIAAMREEYRNNPLVTVEYLADKYGRSTTYVGQILSNRKYPDPNYESPKKKGGSKRSVFLPDHIKELKDLLTPTLNTAHRAKGQNYVINRFK